VIEECPSPSVDGARRRGLVEAAVALARAVRYRGVGTMEFLVTPDAFYFLEMNTRLQVEHPVTELAIGHDLVRLQLVVAARNELPVTQDQITLRGHAIEARVYAEDAARGFLPQAGAIAKARWPGAPFVRVDAGVESGDTVPVHYDPILAKIVTWGMDRSRALERLTAALDDALVHGVITNLPFLRALIRAREVAAGAFDTEWIEREFLGGFQAVATAPAPELALAAAALSEQIGGANGKDGRTAERVKGAPDPYRALGRWRLPGLD
jgi:acetyl/propionyl-CoA carboxylase alpha subunit